MNKIKIAYELGQLRCRVDEEGKELIDRIVGDLDDTASNLITSPRTMSLTYPCSNNTGSE